MLMPIPIVPAAGDPGDYARNLAASEIDRLVRSYDVGQHRVGLLRKHVEQALFDLGPR